MKITRLLTPALMTSLLCGALMTTASASPLTTGPLPTAPSGVASDAPPPVPTEATPDASTSGTSASGASVASNPAASDAASSRYSFTCGQVGSEVFVRLNDAQDEDDAPILLDVLSESGLDSRMARAQVIAKRLQDLCNADPSFVSHLAPGHVGNQVVVGAPGIKTVVTADPRSRRAANAPTCDVYAQWIIEKIDDHLKGIKFRDATFDYLLTDDAKTGYQKQARAHEYYLEGMDAYLDSKKAAESQDDRQSDVQVAEAKLSTAIALAPNYEFCKLQLANVFAEQGDKRKAHDLYHYVATASDTDQEDKDDAKLRDQQLNTPSS